MIYLIEIFGIAAFATSGVLASRHHRPDIIGGLTLGFITAMAGGVIRDAILGVPARTFQDPVYFFVITGSVVLVLLLPQKILRMEKGLEIADGIGLGVFNAGGLMVALESDTVTQGFAVILGIVTGCGGGILRSVLCAEMPSLLKRGELYITACIIGSVCGLISQTFELSEGISFVIVAAVTTTIRLLAIKYEWKVPEVNFRSENDE